MCFFSIIIPVYNVEDYLKQCVNSVLAQSFIDYEIILVDDGSTDNSGMICDEYAKKDKRVKIIHKENGGLSSARNCGIRESVGNYLLFLDSDDYWKGENNLKILYESIMSNNFPQVIVFAATLLYPNGNCKQDGFSFSNDYFKGKSLQELKWMISNNLIVGSACTKAVKRDFLVGNNLLFKEGIKSEDIEWVFRLSCLLPSYYFINSHFYIYRKLRDGSISSSVSVEHIKQYLGIIIDFCQNVFVMEDIKKVFFDYVAYQYSIVCAYIANIKQKEKRNELLDKAKECSFLFKYNKHPKQKKVNLVYRIFGYRITVFLLGLYIK